MNRREFMKMTIGAAALGSSAHPSVSRHPLTATEVLLMEREKQREALLRKLTPNEIYTMIKKQHDAACKELLDIYAKQRKMSAIYYIHPRVCSEEALYIITRERHD